MSVGDDLLDAVLAAPDDDAPRLAYADYLQELGDPRGELIVVQCTAARLDRASDAHRRATLRARALLREHAARWFGEPGHVWESKVRRGFLTEITMTPRNLRTRWSRFAREPIEHVTFRRKGPLLTRGDLAWLADQGARPSKITVVNATGSVELDGPRAFAAVASCDLDDATPVEGTDPALPDGALRAAVTGVNTGAVLSGTWVAQAPALRSLRCTFDTASAIAALLAAPQHRALHALEVHELGVDGFAALVRGELPELARLRVNGDCVAAPLVGSPLLRPVTAFESTIAFDADLVAALEGSAVRELRCLGPTADGIAALAASSTARRLVTWWCGGLTDDMARPIADAPFRRLEWLQLRGLGVGDDTARAIARCAALHALTRLELAWTTVGDPGARALAESVRLARLDDIVLTGGRISPPVRAELAARWPDATIAF